jgi:hypothetical protein
MDRLEAYISHTLSTSIKVRPLPAALLNSIPLYLTETYKLYKTELFDITLLLAEPDKKSEFSIKQVHKHLGLISSNLNSRVVFVTDVITAINRRRLIEKGINFIVPGKQLFLPDLLLDLREDFQRQYKPSEKNKLLPSSQLLLLYYILHKDEKAQLTHLSFKAIAEKFGYTQMAITKAVEYLKRNDLCVVNGSKEKYVRFENDRRELWNMARPYLVNPVIKRVYVDKKPGTYMLKSNIAALAEFSDLNPDNQQYYAIEKSIYYGFRSSGGLVNENDTEGEYCLEVWKYDPLKIADDNNYEGCVDPLSLYLSLKNVHDERVEMALDGIIDKYIW